MTAPRAMSVLLGLCAALATSSYEVVSDSVLPSPPVFDIVVGLRVGRGGHKDPDVIKGGTCAAPAAAKLILLFML